MTAYATASGFLEFKQRMEGQSLSLPARKEAEVLWRAGRTCKVRVPLAERKLVGTSTLEANTK